MKFVVSAPLGVLMLPYAGPDRTQTLPERHAGKQFPAWCESSHLVYQSGFSDNRPHPNAARLSSFALPGGAGFTRGQIRPSSSISVTSAAIGDRSERFSVTCAKSGCPFSFSTTATTPS